MAGEVSAEPGGRLVLDSAERLGNGYDFAPWRAEVVLIREPYQCIVSGRTGSRIALRLDDTVDPILNAPAVITGVIEAGLDVLDGALGAEGPLGRGWGGVRRLNERVASESLQQVRP